MRKPTPAERSLLAEALVGVDAFVCHVRGGTYAGRMTVEHGSGRARVSLAPSMRLLFVAGVRQRLLTMPDWFEPNRAWGSHVRGSPTLTAFTDDRGRPWLVFTTRIGEGGGEDAIVVTRYDVELEDRHRPMAMHERSRARPEHVPAMRDRALIAPASAPSPPA